MNLLHFIIFIVVLYYCAYVLDFAFFFFLLTVVNYCRRTPLGALIKSFNSFFCVDLWQRNVYLAF